MTDDILPIRRALISVSDKTSLLELGGALRAAGVEVVEITADMVDARRWDGAGAKASVDAGIARVLAQRGGA